MKLNFFNPWKKLGRIYGIDVEYQTSRIKNGRNFVTYIRDSKEHSTIVSEYGSDADSSKEKAINLLKSCTADQIRQAIVSKEPLRQTPVQQKDIDWRDGANHRYKAQKRIVGESKETPKIRNFVAKNSRKVNKAGPMADKKNDYKRKPKHSKKSDNEE